MTGLPRQRGGNAPSLIPLRSGRPGRNRGIHCTGQSTPCGANASSAAHANEGNRPTAEIYRLRPEIGAEARLATVGNYVILFRIRKDTVRIERVVHGGRDLLLVLDGIEG
jgi:hypothetical protein